MSTSNTILKQATGRNAVVTTVEIARPAFRCTHVATIAASLWLLAGLQRFNDEACLAVAATCVGAAGLALWRLATTPGAIWNLCALASLSLVFAQSTGIVVGYFAFSSTFSDPLEYAVRLSGAPSLNAYSLTLSYVMAFSLGLAILSETPIAARLARTNRQVFHAVARGRLEPLVTTVAILIGVQIALLAFGKWALRGYVSEGYETRKLDWYADFLGLIRYVNLVLAVILAGRLSQREIKDPIHTIVAVVFLGVAMLSILTQGRSFMLFSTFLVFAIWPEVTGNPLRMRKTLIPGAILLGLVWQASLLSNYIRSDDSGIEEWQNVDIREIFPTVLPKFADSEARAKQSEKMVRNLGHRTLVAGALAKIMATPNTRIPLLGQELTNSVMFALPSMLIGSKAGLIAKEGMIYVATGIYFKDAAESVYLSAYLDAWYFGAITHPLLIFLMLWTVGTLAKPSMPILALMALAPWLFFAVAGINEGSLTAIIRQLFASTVVLAVGIALNARPQERQA